MEQFEAKTGCKREYFFYAILSIPVLIVALLMGGDLIIIGLAFVYPGIKTAEAVEKNDGQEMQRWLAYWVVICVSFCVGWVIDTFFFWIPALFWMKIAYNLWLLAPEPYSGTMMIYGGFLGPKVRQLLPQLKSQLNSVVSAGRSITSPRKSGGGQTAGGGQTSPTAQRQSGGSGAGAHTALPRGSQVSGANQSQVQGSQMGQMRQSGGMSRGGSGGPGSQMQGSQGQGSQSQMQGPQSQTSGMGGSQDRDSQEHDDYEEDDE